ncbi:MAG: hypothetical protein RL154_1045 [Pseudomonadota bacterium]
MKVLLTKDVKSLGKAGEIKEVKDGYGNNFLIGKGMAQLATPAVIKQWESKQRQLKEKEAAEIAALNEAAAKLKSVTVKVTHKTGANGALFGAVTKEEIAEALHAQHGIVVDKKSIETDKAIKATGGYTLDLKLGHGIHGVLNLVVEAA